MAGDSGSIVASVGAVTSEYLAGLGGRNGALGAVAANVGTNEFGEEFEHFARLCMAAVGLLAVHHLAVDFDLEEAT